MKTLDLWDFGVFIGASSCDDQYMARLALAALGAAMGVYAIGIGNPEPDALT